MKINELLLLVAACIGHGVVIFSGIVFLYLSLSFSLLLTCAVSFIFSGLFLIASQVGVSGHEKIIEEFKVENFMYMKPVYLWAVNDWHFLYIIGIIIAFSFAINILAFFYDKFLKNKNRVKL